MPPNYELETKAKKEEAQETLKKKRADLDDFLNESQGRVKDNKNETSKVGYTKSSFGFGGKRKTKKMRNLRKTYKKHKKTNKK